MWRRTPGLSVAEQAADSPRRGFELVRRGGHQAEQRRRRPVAEMELDAVDDSVRVARRETVAASTVNVEVDEPGDDGPLPAPGGARRYETTADLGDAFTRGLDPAAHDASRRDHAPGNDH